VFVWAVWAGLTAAAFGTVAAFGTRVPYFDDFELFWLQTMAEWPTPRDFWRPLNEHRIPLPKFVAWAVAQAGGFHLRTLERVGVAALAAAAALLTGVPRAVRGRTRYADAVIPLVLLTPGQAETYVWAVQVGFLLPAALMVTALALLAGAGPHLTAGRTAGVAAAAALLPLCGVQGQVTAGPLGAWLAAAGWAFARGPAARLTAALGGVFALGVLLACTAGLERKPEQIRPAVTWEAARYAVRVLAGGWGPVEYHLGPAEPAVVPSYLGLATAAAVGLAGWWTLRAARQPDQRAAATGCLAFLVGAAALCAAIGVGRAEAARGFLAPRYVTLATPLVAWAYVAAARFGPPATAGRYGGGLFLVAVAVTGPNAAWGVAHVREREDRQTLILADAYRGVPASFLTEHHGAFLYPPDPAQAGPVFERLRDRRVTPFGSVPPEPRLRREPARWSADATPAAGPDGWYEVAAGEQVRIVFVLDLPPAARGLVLRTSAHRPGHPPGAPLRSVLGWEDAPGRPDPQARLVADPAAAGDGRERRVWLGRPVGRVTLTVPGPVRLRVDAVDCLAAE
jgi:hypothetical protein